MVLMKKSHDFYYQWLSFSFFIGGSASFAVSIPTTIIPYFKHLSFLTDDGALLIEQIAIPFFIAYWYGINFCFFICSLYFADWVPKRWRAPAAVLLFLPVGVQVMRTADWTLPFHLDISDVRWMNGFYFIASSIIYLISCIREQDPYIKRNRIRTAFVLSSAVMGSYVSDFLGMQQIVMEHGYFNIESNGAWKYNSFIILWIVLFFIFYSIKYGFMGIKLRIEEQRNDYSMQNMTKGTQILNHTIKNELQKIRYLNTRALTSLEQNRTETAAAALQSIDTVTDHLLEMVNRIRDKAEEIRLEPREQRLGHLIDGAADAIKTLAGDRLELRVELSVDGWLTCDHTHMKEVLNNLLLNAFEAVPAGQKAVIRIQARTLGSKLLITVQDNGQGISEENASRVFAPFFSTKKSAHSYGLGLSYCYAVLQKHGGKITVEKTELGKGTTMQLLLPGKLLRTDTSIPGVSDFAKPNRRSMKVKH
ncbi:sensor histidine kinase [Paenibacillus hexagrammi]|uniref:histidine kinase n=1 Tax=Paenibacillus hexagrammi TaxID=2908839 RepID=A0ABY3SLC6_9BACL|nr:HAMP domain-containing sensor histidine kinase [Paenibacillus sp. YPD9-1]UJF34029.1 HAMP domain-containing histidine kinase [Paenibacillus sp. YPD9-1]